MRKCDSPLDHISVAAPCNVGWDNMVGTERVRFCGECSLNVYNLSAMTKNEAELLISQTEGMLCVRYYRRADGTILTKNCPVGVQALKRRLSRIAGASVSAVLSFFAGILAVTGLRERPLNPGATQGAMIGVSKKQPETNITMGTSDTSRYTNEVLTVGEVIRVEGWEDGRAKLPQRPLKIKPKRR